MLSFDDKLGLVDALCVTAESLGATLSANTARTMVDDLEHFTVPALVDALQGCRRELNGRLTLAAIIQRIQVADGRPGKDEAWSIALASSDETDTVVMTDEIRLAMSAAQPILAVGDKVGARMAFMSAYERLMAEARQLGRPAKWSVSVGFDAQRRVTAIEQAVLMKRIAPEAANLALVGMAQPTISEDGKAIAGLLTGTPAAPSPEVQARLREIRDDMTARTAEREALRLKALQAERDRHLERVNHHLAQAERLQQERGDE
ncbi:hypothetical protein ABQX22_18330 [Xanthomonas sp. WHRI 1810A]|uniref:hypothetical protein n=1 Tax=Xanthomonas sp. WHRI 1810A TaxID=3161565 RepID=UPI0032E8A6A5